MKCKGSCIISALSSTPTGIFYSKSFHQMFLNSYYMGKLDNRAVIVRVEQTPALLDVLQNFCACKTYFCYKFCSLVFWI